MTGRILILVTATFGVALMLITFSFTWYPHYLWNSSASVPVGLYRLQQREARYVSELVAVVPPEPLARFLAAGGYLPRGVPMLKHVLALPGQVVCREGTDVLVDSIVVGVARERDGRDQSLPVWRGCRVIAADELFLMNWQSADSLDGRYFGPIAASAVVGRAQAVWIPKRQ